jgi:isopenicillin N synthase-like dioxygenase
MDEQPSMIDIGGLAERDAVAISRVAEALATPCSQRGMFHVAGHGVPRDQLAEFEDAMRRFFDLDPSEKRLLQRSRSNAWGYYDEELTKNRRDWKEVFDYGAEPDEAEPAISHSDGRNQWPESIPDLRRILLQHYTTCERIALSLLPSLCLSLDLDPDELGPFFRGHSSFVRLNRYPECPDPAPQDAEHFPDTGHLGVHHHTDAGALTLLYQDGVSGLQAQFEDRFILVEPVPDVFTVNLGDMLQVWSNDRYKSPLHRVIVHSDKLRHSAPFFLNPRYDAVCEPLGQDQGLGGRDAPKFSPVSWANFRDQRSAGDYRDYGSEIQIEDFRIGS